MVRIKAVLIPYMKSLHGLFCTSFRFHGISGMRVFSISSKWRNVQVSSISIQGWSIHHILSRIVPEVCEAIWTSLKDKYMSFPKSEEDWLKKALLFDQRWDYPHCVGAIDGKHIVIEAPANSGSLYYNYKNTFSIVLLAMVDADYRFSYVDIGSYGKQSDGGIFSACSLGKALGVNALNLPQDSSIDRANALGPMPYIIVADEAFPLQRHVMRPYPGACATPEIDAYNYRHSRARRVVENAFGILAERWRVFHTKISVKSETGKNCDGNNYTSQHAAAAGRWSCRARRNGGVSTISSFISANTKSRQQRN
ncbi:protein antagonist of like heterochromatin protein 1 [Plakobranchus ocellatus]|uniref:Protein antagonist of like heterochromatin protein 1 n=1 Tax=Plakobranchus ocellatus TaxID=259542 RepID=A0AAV3YGZ4_9GAST|nr:protein antagonist of like heterochromatin protein 1 [Plakobranchus ocellatus]